MSSNRSFRVVANLVVVVAALAVFGCANQIKGSQDTLAPDRMSALQANAALGTQVNSAEWACPGSPNIALKDYIDFNKGIGSFNYTGSQDFTACTSKRVASSYLISGSTSSKQICIYPMLVTGSANIMLAAEPQCYNVKGGAITATFSSSAKINYLVIVDANMTDALDGCLSSSSPCPTHSEGYVQ